MDFARTKSLPSSIALVLEAPGLFIYRILRISHLVKYRILMCGRI